MIKKHCKKCGRFVRRTDFGMGMGDAWEKWVCICGHEMVTHSPCCVTPPFHKDAIILFQFGSDYK